MNGFLRHFVFQPMIGILLLAGATESVCAQSADIREIRLAFHIFNSDGGGGNFHPDSIRHREFLEEMTNWINHKMLHLDTLRPAVPSPFISTMNLQIRLDTIYFHNDSYAWDCSDSLDSEYMRVHYVDNQPDLNYLQKHQTLPVFFGDNYPILGGHVSQVGSKRLIAMRGAYTMFQQRTWQGAVYECGRNLFHELGHALGLSHNFQGGPSGDQCDACVDNGCPQEGTSNNLMDYWPGYGGGISACQLEIIDAHLSGWQGTIADVVINDSCYSLSDAHPLRVSDDQVMEGIRYLHRPVIIENGGVLEITGMVSVPHGQKITILPGGRLIVNGGVVTNLCGDLWGGIEMIQADTDLLPELVLKNGTRIAHASIGVFVRGPSKMIISKTTFQDCVVGLQVDSVRNEELLVEQSDFLASSRFHRSEEGAGLGTFLKLVNSRVRLTHSRLIHEDRFVTLAADQAGTGIHCIDTHLSGSDNSIQYVSIGILCEEERASGYLGWSHSDIDFCATGIMNLGYSVVDIRACFFGINRFNEQSGLGVYHWMPGWVRIANSQFYSEYGGKDLIGIYQQGNRGGTQLVDNNSFETLDYGVIDVMDDRVPHWPEDIMHEQGLGLVLDRNHYQGVNIPYSCQTPQGYGLAYSKDLLSKDPDQFETVLQWPIGGLSLFESGDHLALTLGSTTHPDTHFPQHNFFVNLFSDSNDFIPPEVDAAFGLRESWGYESKRRPEKNFTVEEMLAFLDSFEAYPHHLRNSEVRDIYLEAISSWPNWALIRWINLAEKASHLDSVMSQMVREIAHNQCDSLDFIPLAQENDCLHSVDRPFPAKPEILTPDQIFCPGIPPMDLGVEHPFSVYPNPANDRIIFLPGPIAFSGIEAVVYRIFDSSGRAVLHGSGKEPWNLVIPVHQLTPGVYSLRISSDKTFLGARKFIILR